MWELVAFHFVDEETEAQQDFHNLPQITELVREEVRFESTLAGSRALLLSLSTETELMSLGVKPDDQPQVGCPRLLPPWCKPPQVYQFPPPKSVGSTLPASLPTPIPAPKSRSPWHRPLKESASLSTHRKVQISKACGLFSSPSSFYLTFG